MKLGTRKYIAYGSNLNVAQMRSRCPDATVLGTGWLENHRLVYKGSKTGGYLTVEEAKGCRVPVAIWEISQMDEKALDRYEGYPRFYRKEYTNIKLNKKGAGRKKIVTGMIYIMNGRDYEIPHPYYIQTCKVGYAQFGLDTAYLNEALDYTREKVAEQDDFIYSDGEYGYWIGNHYHFY